MITRTQKNYQIKLSEAIYVQYVRQTRQYNDKYAKAVWTAFTQFQKESLRKFNSDSGYFQVSPSNPYFYQIRDIPHEWDPDQPYLTLSPMHARNTYKVFSRITYNKLKHQFPRMKQHQIVGAIIKRWQSLSQSEIYWTYRDYLDRKYQLQDSSSSDSKKSVDRSSEGFEQQREKHRRKYNPPIFQSSIRRQTPKQGVRVFMRDTIQKVRSQGSDFERDDTKKNFYVSSSEQQWGIQKYGKTRVAKLKQPIRVQFSYKVTDTPAGKLQVPIEKTQTVTYQQFVQIQLPKLRRQHDWTMNMAMQIVKLTWKHLKLNQNHLKAEQQIALRRRSRNQKHYAKKIQRIGGKCEQCSMEFKDLRSHIERKHPKHAQSDQESPLIARTIKRHKNLVNARLIKESNNKQEIFEQSD